ncbi:MAG: DUF2029 domain-containing protein [Lamprocystis purpurea]|jgi:hypothetical protein|uniref:glycosyltransferase family 87 protein n=1 Tax=Lamprocystis purpurea TaxID=61598 RepID=UPI000377FFFA|nr:glycosyltransferase family 87 protein [Lamprocystis purpurea]MBV5273456.1 DUF2029 domain-containing protein [Lamprocystis purpurea]
MVLLVLGAACLLWGFYRFVSGYLLVGKVGDFAVYYEAAKALLHHLPVYEQAITSPNGFLYPPVSLGLFVLFAPFSPQVAYSLFAAVVYGSTAVASWLFLRQVAAAADKPISRLMLIACAVFGLGFAPTYLNVIAGQVNTLVLLLCVFYLYLLDRRPFLAGVLLGLAAWIKVYPVLLGIFVFAHSRYRNVLLGLACVFFAAPLLLAWLVPVNLYRDYFFSVLPQVSRIGTVHIYNQSIAAAVHRFFRPLADAFNWEVYTLSTVAQGVSTLVLSASAIVVLLWLRRDVAARKNAGFALLLALIPMLVSLGWGYTYVLVLPLIFMLLLHAAERGIWWQAAVLILISGFCIPSYSEVQVINRLPEILAQVFYARYPLATLAMVIAALALLGRRTDRAGRSTDQ